MSQQESSAKGNREQPKFPHRDADGRIMLLTEFLAYTLMVIAVGVLMLAAIDALFMVLGFGTFGQISGWISGILAVFVFVDDFRAYKDRPSRWLVAIGALLLAGFAALGILSRLPEFWLPLFNGALSVTVAAMLYAVLWFTGIRLIGAQR
jgi:hypothetical protein